jgi:hypothetical protein
VIGLHDLVDVYGAGPPASQVPVMARQGGGTEIERAWVFDVLEDDRDAKVLEIEMVEFVDELLAKNSLFTGTVSTIPCIGRRADLVLFSRTDLCWWRG